ncbi:sigma-54-dependent transcriptional regulator [Accumulibacter sp.]|uniref:sigma-54-dependent transcriptional regulator n=1 Tax=Accumulibacter sp. TaxID=2053492 RepID=UPI0035ADA67C
MRRRVLISWIAVNNDPYERERPGGDFRLVDGFPILGPTLTLLFDPDSVYAGSISDFVLFRGRSREGKETRESQAVSQTLDELRARAPELRIHQELWEGDDPTDHGQIYEFLRERLATVRRRFADKELVIHVSPGTPSMQTVLVLMGETGFIDAPFSLVKSYRKHERNGRTAVVPVQLGIDSYYKAYRSARPAEMSSEDAAVVWDPARFQSERMRQIFDEARRFAQLNVPVLLLGERGTGKTTLAGWIRSHSPYRVKERDAHWPAVACGQYSPETMRAELFGYRRGAFTGALRDHEGLLAVAHKDTLFLDEVGDVGRDLQRLLIKAVEEKTYMRLGDDRQLTSDFRLISATNLTDDKLRERLDPDFLDRISMLTLRLPPLREIPEEIPWLWEMVFAQASRRAGSVRARLPDSAHRAIVDELSRHPLLGNLRDLFRVAYRTLAANVDRHSPLSPAASSEYGLAGIRELGAGAEIDSLPRAVARAFSESANLDALIQPGETIKTKVVERALKGYLADEFRRIAKSRGVSPETLCDVTDRALRDWSASREWKK